MRPLLAEDVSLAISVVIATFNRAERLRACLDALAAQSRDRSTDGRFEVVIVDDGSTDGTPDLLATYRAPFPLKVIRQENGGQPAALNRGVAEAGGRICLLMDDDIVAGPGLIDEHLRVQRETGGVLAAGRLRLSLPAGDWYARRFADEWERHYSHLDAGEKPLTAAACYGANLSFPRDSFLEVGGFARDLARGYDLDLAYRLIAAGLAPRYLPRAEAVQDEHKGRRALLRDEERAGEGVVALYRRLPATLPVGGLTEFHAASFAARTCRRFLLAVGVPATVLSGLGPLLDPPSRGHWYRFVRAYAFWRGVRRSTSQEEWRGLTGAVTILLYHAVTVAGERPTRFVVDAREFAWQMGWLASAGYRVLGLGDYVRSRRNHGLPTGRSVVVTFDDGYVDNGAIAAPILSSRGLRATLFLVTDSVGTANRWDSEGALAARPILSWEKIRELERSGVRFAPHGKTHRAMAGLTDEELASEIGESWAALQRELTDPIPVLAFPFGLHDEPARAAAERLGLWGACTAKPGRNTLRTPAYALRRAEIGGDTGRLGFRLAVRFGDVRPIRNRKRLRS